MRVPLAPGAQQLAAVRRLRVVPGMVTGSTPERDGRMRSHRRERSLADQAAWSRRVGTQRTAHRNNLTKSSFRASQAEFASNARRVTASCSCLLRGPLGLASVAGARLRVRSRGQRLSGHAGPRVCCRVSLTLSAC